MTPFCSAGSYTECDLRGRLQGFACNLKFERDKNFFNGGYAVLDRTLVAVYTGCPTGKPFYFSVPAPSAGTAHTATKNPPRQTLEKFFVRESILFIHSQILLIPNVPTICQFLKKFSVDVLAVLYEIAVYFIIKI